MSNSLKNELFNILSGKSKISHGSIIQTIACYLENGENSGRITKNEKHFKEEEAKDLIDFIEANDLWLKEIDFTQYVSEGAEQRVYLKDGDHVLKLNDGIYYSSWKDHFHNLLVHNYFFPDTEYDLIGFTKDNDVLYAVVQQKYVTVNATTDLNKVKEFLESNGFQNNRNHDYIHKDLGIILKTCMTKMF